MIDLACSLVVEKAMAKRMQNVSVPLTVVMPRCQTEELESVVRIDRSIPDRILQLGEILFAALHFKFPQ